MVRSWTLVLVSHPKRGVSDAIVAKMRRALEDPGIEFTNGKRPGVRLGK